MLCSIDYISMNFTLFQKNYYYFIYSVNIFSKKRDKL